MTVSVSHSEHSLKPRELRLAMVHCLRANFVKVQSTTQLSNIVMSLHLQPQHNKWSGSSGWSFSSRSHILPSQNHPSRKYTKQTTQGDDMIMTMTIDIISSSNCWIVVYLCIIPMSKLYMIILTFKHLVTLLRIPGSRLWERRTDHRQGLTLLGQCERVVRLPSERNRHTDSREPMLFVRSLVLLDIVCMFVRWFAQLLWLLWCWLKSLSAFHLCVSVKFA